MAGMLAPAPILLRADMLATLTGAPTNEGNAGDAGFGIALPGVTAFGPPEQLLRLVWYENVTFDQEFLNGQFWRLETYDPSKDPDGDPTTGNEGWSLVPGYEQQLNPRQDLVSGLGACDDYVVFDTPSGFLLYDIDGGLPTTPTDMVFLAQDENGDLNRGDNDGNLDFADATAAVCFCAGTLIDTPIGPRAVEMLRPGDAVLTRDHGPQVLRWVGRLDLTADAVRAAPWLQPVRIAPGSLAPGVPDRVLRVSPQHRLLVRSRIVQRMTGAPEVLVAACHLCGLPGIARDPAGGPVSYLHLLFDHHEVVTANAAPAESLFVGVQALRALSPGARREIAVLFPQLIRAADPACAARPLLPGRRARRLALRHLGSRQALVGG